MENVTTPEFVVTGKRWIILTIFMFSAALTQINWITFAPITDESASFYNVSSDDILLLAVVYMIAYLLINFPATWVLDKYGLKWGTGVGVILTGVFSMLRPLFGHNYTLVLIAQSMCAIGQPFILNSFTKVAVNWFSEAEKTLATGLGTMSMLLGVIIGMIATPLLYESFGLMFILWMYGIISFVVMIVYLIVVQNYPEVKPNKLAGSQVFDFRGLFGLFKNRDFNIILLLVFIGLGTFNAILSDIDNIFSRFKDNTEAAGFIGGLLIIGGVFGAGILSTISDMKGKRKIFLNLAMLVSVPSILLLNWLDTLTPILLTSFVFGFFLVAALPVGLIYAAEITYPVSEEASNGLMMTLGQLAGILFLLSFNMVFLAVLFALGFVFSLFMEDSKPIFN